MVSDIINKTVSIFPALKKGGKKGREKIAVFAYKRQQQGRVIAATTELFCGR